MDIQTLAEVVPDFHSREWWIDEYGHDPRPYTAEEWPSPWAARQTIATPTGGGAS